MEMGLPVPVPLARSRFSKLDRIDALPAEEAVLRWMEHAFEIRRLEHYRLTMLPDGFYLYCEEDLLKSEFQFSWLIIEK